MGIVFGTDHSEASRNGEEVAARLALKRGETLYLVHAVPPPAPIYGGGEYLFAPVLPTQKEIENGAREELEAAAKALATATGAQIVTRLAVGRPDDVILETARDVRASLIVAATQATSALARWVGSTADRLARRSPYPVLVLRGYAGGILAWLRNERPLRAAMGVDFDESTETAADGLQLLLAAGPCEVQYVHAYPAPVTNAPVTMRDLEAATIRDLEVRLAEQELDVTHWRVHLVQGRPASAICAFAEKSRIDVITVATHGRKGLERALLGSVALGVLHGAPCPVLIAPIAVRPV